MTGKTILLVEDNPKVLRNNITILKSQNAGIISASTLAEARLKLSPFYGNNGETGVIQYPDAAVIDIMLPDGSGIDLLHEVRSSAGPISSLPILLLTAKGSPDDIVSGLSMGADDYLAKPYDLNVFAARIEALLRRTLIIKDSISSGPLLLNLISSRAFYNGNDLFLTQKEFALLLLLMQNEGKNLPAAYLYEKAWGLPPKEGTSALKVQMSNLKKKLTIAERVFIETSWGEGYSIKIQ